MYTIIFSHSGIGGFHSIDTWNTITMRCPINVWPVLQGVMENGRPVLTTSHLLLVLLAYDCRWAQVSQCTSSMSQGCLCRLEATWPGQWPSDHLFFSGPTRSVQSFLRLSRWHYDALNGFFLQRTCANKELKGPIESLPCKASATSIYVQAPQLHLALDYQPPYAPIQLSGPPEPPDMLVSDSPTTSLAQVRPLLCAVQMISQVGLRLSAVCFKGCTDSLWLIPSQIVSAITFHTW